MHEYIPFIHKIEKKREELQPLHLEINPPPPPPPQEVKEEEHPHIIIIQL
jgi:hypothetical protein